MAELVVVAPGPLTLVQDAGRPGYAAMGVGRSGAFDTGAYELGRRLVGNAVGAAALEVLLGGLTVRATAATRAVITEGSSRPPSTDAPSATANPSISCPANSSGSGTARGGSGRTCRSRAASTYRPSSDHVPRTRCRASDHARSPPATLSRSARRLRPHAPMSPRSRRQPMASSHSMPCPGPVPTGS